MQPNVLYTYSSGVCPAAAPLWLRICWSWHLSASASWRNKCNHARCRRPVEKLSLSLSHSDSFRPSLCNSFHSAIRFLSRCKALVAEHWKETDRQPKAISRRLFLFYFSKGERETTALSPHHTERCLRSSSRPSIPSPFSFATGSSCFRTPPVSKWNLSKYCRSGREPAWAAGCPSHCICLVCLYYLSPGRTCSSGG